MTTANQAPAAPQPGTPEYDAAMAARFDASQGVPPVETPPAEPELILGKFKTVEDLAKSYEELQRKLGQQQPKPQAPAGTEGGDTNPLAISGTTGDNQAEAAAAAANAGLDFDALTTKFSTNGKIDDADYAALEAKGITRATVDNYIAGQQAIAAQRQADVYASVGGEDAFRSIAEWAGANLSQAELDAYNRVVDAGDINATKLAIAGLKAKWSAAGNGTAPALVQADGGTPTADVFRSIAEQTAAIRDPRYKLDPAYRASVAAKIGRSNVM